MGEKMSLQQVRDSIRYAYHDGGNVNFSDLRRWADAITAHLTQPAQAVDVGAKVADAWRDAAAACLGKHSRLFRYVCEEADHRITAHLSENSRG